MMGPRDLSDRRLWPASSLACTTSTMLPDIPEDACDVVRGYSTRRADAD